ncbi:SDR family oxidoreductase [Streptomyces sp. NPDC056296]|uniref:SDR family oxidoreductase n=1 Tax=Streptomyces sp. NPDC056296 TaxID=3345775 RepID=UPI0035D93DB9
MRDLHGRTAFITGGSRGIGLGIAGALARHGVKLALVDVDEDALRQARRELADHTDVRVYTLDVTDRDAYARTATAVVDDLGPVTLLFNNAGIADSTSPSRMSYGMWDHVVGVNLNGVYNGLQTFLPLMLEAGTESHIVNTSSEAGLGEFGSGFLYHASKYAVVGLSESLRAELAPRGIGVSVLCPGPVATDIVENTRRMRPGDAPAQSTKVAAILDVSHAVLKEHGAPADTVGELVVDAVRRNLPYIATRNHSKEALTRRTAALHEAMDQAEQFITGRRAPGLEAGKEGERTA